MKSFARVPVSVQRGVFVKTNKTKMSFFLGEVTAAFLQLTDLAT